MRWLHAAVVSCVLGPLAGCAKTDCIETRDALARVARDMQKAPLRGEMEAPAGFAERMKAEVSGLEIEHRELRSALDAFVDATGNLASTRERREQAALELAQAHDELSDLRRELDAAYAALGDVCEHGVERCLVQAELKRIEGVIDPNEGGAPDPVRLAAARIRSVIEETSRTMQGLLKSQVELRKLEVELQELERRAARLGLQIGVQCSG